MSFRVFLKVNALSGERIRKRSKEKRERRKEKNPNVYFTSFICSMQCGFRSRT